MFVMTYKIYPKDILILLKIQHTAQRSDSPVTTMLVSETQKPEF